MTTSLSTDAAALVAAVNALPVEQRVAVLGEVVRGVFEAVAGPVVVWGDDDAPNAGTGTLSERIEAGREERQALEGVARELSKAARGAEACVRAVASAHEDVVRRIDTLEFDLLGAGSAGDGASAERMFAPGEFAADELAVALGVRPGTVEAWSEAAHGLRTRTPRLWVLCGRGEVGFRSAPVVLEETDHLAPDDRDRVLDVVLRSRIAHSSPSAARRRVREVLRGFGLERAVEQADREALVEVTFAEHPDQPTLTDVHVVLPAEDAWRLKVAIDQRADELLREHADSHAEAAVIDDLAPPGSVHEYSRRRARVDAFIDLMLGAVRFEPVVTLHVPVRLRGTSVPVGGAFSDAGVSGGSGMPTQADLGVPAGGKGGFDASAGALPSAALSGVALPTAATSAIDPSSVEVPGVGVVSGDAVQSLVGLVGARVRVALTDEASGVVAWTSTTTYRPTAAQRRFVEARDEHCRFPGCMRPARFCDADHVVAHAAGGETAPANLQLLCRHHHRAKTFGGWVVAMTPDGECVWEAPTGAYYRTFPGDLVAHPLAAHDAYRLIA